MPPSECYLEVGTLEGRTLEAAGVGNGDKLLIGCDPCDKYHRFPEEFDHNIRFIKGTWQDVIRDGFPIPIGCTFYDGLHDTTETFLFMNEITSHLADESVLVLDDWDRESVRRGAFTAQDANSDWRLLREMPEYGDGLTCPQHHFGYSFGVAVWGYKRG